MKAAGVKDYKSFVKKITKKITNKPISFEVFSDDIDEMYEQGKKIADIANNIVVKIPITNSKGEPTIKTINKLKEHNFENTIIIITGDIFHNKNLIESHGIELFNKLITGLTSFTDVYIIRGNHDYRQDNKDNIDLIGALINNSIAYSIIYFGLTPVSDILPANIDTISSLVIFAFRYKL